VANESLYADDFDEYTPRATKRKKERQALKDKPWAACEIGALYRSI